MEHFYVIQNCLWLTPETSLCNKQIRTTIKLVLMRKNTSSMLTAVSALRHPAVAGTRCYVSGIQKLANSIELRSRVPGDQTAADTV
jgi:hypothetical protein